MLPKTRFPPRARATGAVLERCASFVFEQMSGNPTMKMQKDGLLTLSATRSLTNVYSFVFYALLLYLLLYVEYERNGKKSLTILKMFSFYYLIIYEHVCIYYIRIVFKEANRLPSK